MEGWVSVGMESLGRGHVWGSDGNAQMRDMQ